MLGRVKFFNSVKGFGFITSEDSIDYFYHVSEVKDFNLVEYGDVVKFTPTSNEKGNKAIEVSLLQKYSINDYSNNNRSIHVHHTYQRPERPQMSDELKAFVNRSSW